MITTIKLIDISITSHSCVCVCVCVCVCGENTWDQFSVNFK